MAPFNWSIAETVCVTVALRFLNCALAWSVALILICTSFWPTRSPPYQDMISSMSLRVVTGGASVPSARFPVLMPTWESRQRGVDRQNSSCLQPRTETAM